MSLGINGNNYDRWQLGTDAVGGGSQTRANQNTSNDSVEIGGDLYQPSTETEDLEAELGELQETVGANGTTGVSGTNSTTSTSNDEIEDKKDELDANQQRMEAVEAEIEKLSEEVAQTIADALALQEAAVAEQKEETEKAIKEQIQAYVDANKNGDGMTQEELQANIQSALPNTPNLAGALAKVIDANTQISEIDGLLSELKGLITDSANLQDEIEALEKSSAGSKSGGCTDPIGFVSNNVEYNFFTDKDNDGQLSQTNEFLGSENQWEEMKAADNDGNGTVTAEELAANNIFLAGADGNVIKDAQGYKDAFGEDFSIDLNSYAEGGTHSAIDTTSDTNGNGTVDQTLLGTFNVNVNGEDVLGYNTLDDTEWLSENYGIENSSAASGSNVVTDGNGELDVSQLGDLKSHGEFYNLALQKNNQAKEQLAGIEEAIGFTGEEVDAFKEVEAAKGLTKAQQFVDSVEITPRERETSSTGSGTTGSTLPEDVVAALDAKLGEGFSAGVAALAQKYGCSETDLIGLMYSECGLNPTLVNEIGATGLIQFIPETAASLGTSTEALANMSAVEQLEYVDKFLGQYLQEGGNYSGGDLYATIFLPAYRDQEILTSSGDGTGYYEGNSGLDVDGNGDISKSDLDQRIANKYQEALSDLLS